MPDAGHNPTVAQESAEAAAPASAISPDPAPVREQLERILGSSEFLGSDRVRRFLRYVVEETLAGRANRIKAFSVAIAAFDRDESFDPQADPIVRIEAGRLRRSLERYYLTAGAGDPVRIQIPKGGYVPTFTWQGSQGSGDPAGVLPGEVPAAAVPASARGAAPRRSALSRPLVSIVAVPVVLLVAVAALWTTVVSDEPVPVLETRPNLPQPSVAVLSFSLSGGENPVASLSSGMTAELVRELSRYSSIFVLGPQSLRRFGASPDVTVVGEQSGAGFVLSGNIHHLGQKIRVDVQLSDASTGAVAWAEAYERDFAVEGVFDLQTEIAQDVVRQIGQPQGAIARFDWKRTRGTAPETWDAYDCVVQADDLHRRVLPPALAPEIRACLHLAVAREPAYADAWVMLALIEIDALRFTPGALIPQGSGDTALAAAQRAVELAPDSGRAHLALMMGLFFRGEVEQALAEGELAARLSPRDPDILGEVGLRNIISGDLSAGVSLVDQSIELYQDAPLTSRLALAMAALREGRYEEASDAAMGKGQGANFVYWSMVAAIHGKAGRQEEARFAAAELLKLYPDFADWAWPEMEVRNPVPELTAAMVEGWRSAGLPVSLTAPAKNPGLLRAGGQPTAEHPLSK